MKPVYKKIRIFERVYVDLIMVSIPDNIRTG